MVAVVAGVGGVDIGVGVDSHDSEVVAVLLRE